MPSPSVLPVVFFVGVVLVVVAVFAIKARFKG
jgi:hypothetical protein